MPGNPYGVPGYQSSIKESPFLPVEGTKNWRQNRNVPPFHLIILPPWTQFQTHLTVSKWKAEFRCQMGLHRFFWNQTLITSPEPKFCRCWRDSHFNHSCSTINILLWSSTWIAGYNLFSVPSIGEVWWLHKDGSLTLMERELLNTIPAELHNLRNKT